MNRRDPLAEPFPVGQGWSQSTPIRNPWAMLVLGLGMQLATLAMAVWAIAGFVSGDAGNLTLPTLVLGVVVLVAVPLPVLLIGLARVRWLYRYRRATGVFPTPWKPDPR